MAVLHSGESWCIIPLDAWGFSSAGRASRWQRECQGFESPNLHHLNSLFFGIGPHPVNSNANLECSLPYHLEFRPGRCLLSACLLLAFLATLVSPALAARTREPAPAQQTVPDMLMLVLVMEQMDNVSFTYREVVKRAKAEEHLGNLLRETAWTANNLRIEDLNMADGGATTTVEFSTLGTVNLQSGGFPLEPIIKAFKDLGYLEIQFMVSMPFDFRGLRHFENKHVKIVLNRGTNVYGYSVFIKDPNFKALGLPLVQLGNTAAPKSADAKRSNLLGLALIVLLGLLAAMLVYFLTKRAAGSRES